jgi:hypothetical protein
MLIATPLLTYFGDSFSEYNGRSLNNSRPLGSIDSSKLNNNLESDTVEFTTFEETISSYILARLGHPIIRVELTPFQIKTCIDEAITKLHAHTPINTTQYCAFEASANISMYRLPPYIIQNLSYVTYKKTLLGSFGGPGTIENDAALFYFSNMFNHNQFSMGDWFVMQQHFEMFRKVYGRDGTFSIVDNQYIMLTPTPSMTPEPVIIEYRALNSTTLSPLYKLWIQKYALAVAKGVLGGIRSKFKTVPGPEGGAQLNGSDLLQESMKEKEALDEQLQKEIEEPPMFSVY